MLLCPWNFPVRNIGLCCHFLFQGTLLTQGLNAHLLESPALAGGFFTTVPPGTSHRLHSVQSLSRVQFLETPRTAARQASLSITNSRSLLKLMSTESVMPSNRLILCHLLLLLPSIPPSIRVFSNESALHIRWLKYWSFSFNISPSNEHPGLISFRMDGWTSLQSKGLSRVFSNTGVQKHQFFSAQLYL